MVTTTSDTATATSPAAPPPPAAADREPALQASDLAPNYAAWRGVRARAADLMSRLERRAVYLPGV